MTIEHTSADDQVARLQAQIQALQKANVDLATQNAQLDDELANTKSELQETQILLAQAVVKASRPSQSTSTASPMRYTPVVSTSRTLKRTRSPTLEYVDNPPPPSKKGKERERGRGSESIIEQGLASQSASSSGPARTPSIVKVSSKKGKDRERERSSDSVAEPGSSRSTSRSVPPRTPSIVKVKESPRKSVKLEFAPTVEVITIGDSDTPSEPEPSSAAGNTVETGQSGNDASDQPPPALDSDLEDPNVLSEQPMNTDVPVPCADEDRSRDTPAVHPEHSANTEQRPGSEPTPSWPRRFSSMSSLTTMSTLTPLPSTPGLDDFRETSSPTIDLKPKREQLKHEQDVFTLPPPVLSHYLDGAKALPIPAPGPIRLCVPRTFLRLAYGGSDQQFVQYMPAARNPVPPPGSAPGPTSTVAGGSDGAEVDHNQDQDEDQEVQAPRIRRVVFPMLNANPAMPSAPGAPGLVFASRHEILYDPPWTLFCKDERNEKKAVWLYLGEYESELVGKMTKEQFVAQSDVVQNRWVDLILTQKRRECYMSMRARIVLRAAGLIPLVNKEREEELVKAEVEKIKHGKGKSVTAEQILTAFRNGDEGVDIIRMKCVKYDHFFANDIVRRFPEYPAMLAAAKAEKLKQKASESTSKSTTGKKRKRSTARANSEGEDEDGDELEALSDDADEDEPCTSSISKGKRKAPSSSQKRKGKQKARETKKARTLSRASSKSGSAPGSAAASTSTSSRPRRRTSTSAPPIAAIIDSSDNDEAAEDDIGSGDDFNDLDGDEDHDVLESKPTARSSSSAAGSGARRSSSVVYVQIPTRAPSQRPRKMSQKVMDAAGPAEH